MKPVTPELSSAMGRLADLIEGYLDGPVSDEMSGQPRLSLRRIQAFWRVQKARRQVRWLRREFQMRENPDRALPTSRGMGG